MKELVTGADDSGMHLPDLNVYVPECLDLHPDSPSTEANIDEDVIPPSLVSDKPGFGRLYHSLDR